MPSTKYLWFSFIFGSTRVTLGCPAVIFVNKHSFTAFTSIASSLGSTPGTRPLPLVSGSRSLLWSLSVLLWLLSFPWLLNFILDWTASPIPGLFLALPLPLVTSVSSIIRVSQSMSWIIIVSVSEPLYDPRVLLVSPASSMFYSNPRPKLFVPFPCFDSIQGISCIDKTNKKRTTWRILDSKRKTTIKFTCSH